MGDPGLFQGTFELEEQVMEMLGDMLHLPNACGYISTGGTESNIQAVRAMRNRNRSIVNPNIVVPDSAHFSFDKVGDLSGIDIRRAALSDNLQVDTDVVNSLIDSNTVGLVGIAGTTEFGQVDPLETLSGIAVEKGLPFHVDAAFGGFVLPFLKPKYKFDFEIPGVSSVTIDPHKMGLSTIPSGGLLFRHSLDLDNLAVKTPYLTISSQYSLTGTRSGAAVVSTYAVMRHLGRKGYGAIVQRCMDMTERLVAGARNIGIRPVIEPVMNIVALDVESPGEIQNRLYEDFGWRVSLTRNPQALRLVIMPHLDNEIIDMFLADLNTVVNQSQNKK